MVSFALLANIVSFLPVLEILSAPSLPSIETKAALLLMESSPPRAEIVALSPVFITVSLALVPYISLLLSPLLILTGVSTIWRLENFAAPLRGIFPVPTLTIISLPLLVVVA